MKNNRQLILQSLSMDLLRASLGRHRGSHQMADRFIAECHKWIAQLDGFNDQSLLDKLKFALDQNHDRQAEDLLMYSTLIRNRSYHHV